MFRAVACLRMLMLVGIMLAASGPTHVRAGEVHVEGDRVSLAAGEYRVIFERKPAWTLRQMFFGDRMLLGPTGWMQTVIKTEVPDGEDPWIGTGHGREVVEHVDVKVDGEVHALNAGLHLIGERFVLRKRSRLGPFVHWANIELDADGLRERFAYEVAESAQTVDYMYVFMQCMAKSMDSWTVGLADGTEMDGRFVNDGSFTLRKDIRWLASYDPHQEVGLIHAYPQVYESWRNQGNLLRNRAHDRKLYLKVDPHRRPGDRFSYAIELRAFDATEGNWRQRADHVLTRLLAAPVPELEPWTSGQVPATAAERDGRSEYAK